jgi:hypothetical protein
VRRRQNLGARSPGHRNETRWPFWRQRVSTLRGSTRGRCGSGIWFFCQANARAALYLLMEKIKMDDDAQARSALRKILDTFERDARRDFDMCFSNERISHVSKDFKIVREWLDKNPAAPC